MEDLISRQAVLEINERYRGKMPNEINHKIWREIKELPSAQPEQQWIPVTERLPEESSSYFVSGKWASGKVTVGDCEYDKDDGYFQTVWNFDVEAWMTLPEPYKGGEKDG